MSSHRPRGYSPPRYYGDQPRATTGTVYASSFDTGSRGGPSSLPRASVSTISSGRHNVAYQAQPMRKSTYADGKTRTEYAIRPKNENSAPADNRRPLSISTAPMSPTRYNMNVLASPREMTPTARDDSSRLLQPASAHGQHHGFHQRHNSTSMADLDQRDIDSERREKKYHPRPPYVQRVYDERVPARSSDDEWSYTGPREQFDRDFPQDSPGHRLTSRRERPTRDYEIDRSAPRRDPAPVPVNGKNPEKRVKGEGDRHDIRTGFDSDPDHRSEAPRRRPSTRQPVVHQQPGRDDGYSSAKDDYGSRTYASQRSSRYEDDVKPRVRPRDRYQEDDRVREYDRKYHNDRTRDRDYDRERDRDQDRDQERDRHRDRDREREREREPDRDRDRDRERTRDYEKDYRDSKEYDRDYNRNYDRRHNRDERNDRDDRDEIDDRTRTDRRSKPRSRDSSPERSGLKGLATGALGTLAAAGVVKGFTRDQKEKDVEPDDDEPRERRRRKHRRRSRTDDQENASEQEAERRKDDRISSRQQETSSSDTPEDQPSRRRHSHRRHRDDDEDVKPSRRRDDEDTGRDRRRRDDEDTGKERLAITDGRADRDNSRVRTRDEEESTFDAERSSRELVPVPRQDFDTEYLETRTMSPGENEDDRPRRVQLVEPVKDKEESKPKGILKPARQVPFPEDPNPIREGVAPLKDASKDGIPPNARWTKINRVLVNPEALERYHERFEERDDYVIVLRVLTREEIKKFADKTKEIREAREKEWQQKLEEQRRRQPANEGGSSGLNNASDYDDEGTGSRPQLAIEQSPAQPADFHNLQNATSQHIPPRTMSNGSQVPDINVEANYSQNV